MITVLSGGVGAARFLQGLVQVVLSPAKDLGNLGILYAARGELDKAEEHHRKALAIDEEIGNRLGQANELGSLGLVYRGRGDTSRALRHFHQARDIFGEMGAQPQVDKTDEFIAQLQAATPPKKP